MFKFTMNINYFKYLPGIYKFYGNDFISVNFYKCYGDYYRNKLNPRRNVQYLPSYKIREMFLNYFVKDKNHTFINSSPVFLNNDSSLLFVNAGMNQFKSLLLKNTTPSHRFHNLKRAANCQKCIRLSGKHNDLEDVGKDFYHHTFFEMLGNWSFGDYSKKEACEMAWELLTKVYKLDPQNLYVTYFNGDKKSNLPSDEECKNIWLDIGIDPTHIFPFGIKNNFWEMADNGPCGPCTEIHYYYRDHNSSNLPVAKMINAGNPYIIEIWNLVFIQYMRDQDGILKKLPVLNIDTGMGFERLTALLQGTISNYDTDIFIPLFQAIEKNFKVPPYQIKSGIQNSNELDVAYRIIADHSRMFTVAITDGVYPDNYDVGDILRKVIRRAAYIANRIMKTKPGLLSSLVPYIAESLQFYPEISNHVNEIIDIVNEEENLFHQLINKARKARNKMLSENKSNTLNAKNIWELRNIYGLEENMIQDLASEIGVIINWDSYQKLLLEKNQEKSLKLQENSSDLFKVAQLLQANSIQLTEDNFKYNYSTDKISHGVPNINAVVVAIINKGRALIKEINEGHDGMIVTNETNFYSEAGGQVSDIGHISSQDSLFEVKKVHSSLGYIFHEGKLLSGKLSIDDNVKMIVDKDHRLGCSQNHTATHLVNAALKSILPFTFQRSSYVGPDNLKLGFSSKASLSLEDIENIENFVNLAIQQKIDIIKTKMGFEEMLENQNVSILRGEVYPEVVRVIKIGESDKVLSIEPCCGTHVSNTFDIENFVIIPHKSSGGSTRILKATTGKSASKIIENGMELEDKIYKFQAKVDKSLQDIKISREVLHSLLKEVKKLIHECHLCHDISIKQLKKCENVLMILKLKLNDMLNHLDQSNENKAKDMLIPKFPFNALKILQKENIPITNDEFKYDNCFMDSFGVKTISANILAIIEKDKVVSHVNHGLQCIVVTDKTNFYAEGDDQAADVGFISSKDFNFHVVNVFKNDGYVLHEGWVKEGAISSYSKVIMQVDKNHRLSCSQNHTALHLLNAALKKILPYSFQTSAFVGPSQLELNFTSKIHLSEKQIELVEKLVNDYIKENKDVVRLKIPLNQLEDIPPFKVSLIKKFSDSVPVISIGNKSDLSHISKEPCCGTHVSKTADIGNFIITCYKSHKNKEKLLRAVTGNKAKKIQEESLAYNLQMSALEEAVSSCLKKDKLDYLELRDCLNEVKAAKTLQYTELPLLLFRKHQDKLSELSNKLITSTNDFILKGFQEIKIELQNIQNNNNNNNFVVHKILTLGDGKMLSNFALDKITDRPAMFFTFDGHKTLICSCVVPKCYVDDKFSALLWINPVAALLEGQARNLNTDPELRYSIVSKRTDKIEEAMSLAKDYIRSHLKSY